MQVKLVQPRPDKGVTGMDHKEQPMVNIKVEVPTLRDGYLIKTIANHLRRSAAAQQAWQTMKARGKTPRRGKTISRKAKK